MRSASLTVMALRIHRNHDEMAPWKAIDMTHHSAWRRFSAPGGDQFDFPWASMSDEEAASTARLHAHEIRARQPDPHAAKDWISLTYRLPADLRQVLLDELDRGNLMIGIGQTGWPTSRGIVATMRDRFHEGRTWPQSVSWSVLDDPRQWREDVVQRVDDQDFMLMT
ncbi:hypothetical protein [Roseateles chitinivorans]|uniref:hypothetical protein n=1 Tax=Roseateles chitinivorans TaxID=2917965 RepID=UPI003D66E3DA